MEWGGEEVKHPKGLERENGQLKRLVAEQALDDRMRKDLAERSF